jgi:FdhD protein
MGRNKALLPYHGEPIIASIYRTMAELFEDIVVVTNSPADYDFLPCPTIADIHVGKGAMAGVHAGLSLAGGKRIFVVGCDMPFINPQLVRFLAGRLGGEAALVPESAAGLEPLHAFYSPAALPLLDAALCSGNVRLIDLLSRLNATVVPAAEIAAIAPDWRSFVNLNTPEEYSSLG